VAAAVEEEAPAAAAAAVEEEAPAAAAAAVEEEAAAAAAAAVEEEVAVTAAAAVEEEVAAAAAVAVEEPVAVTITEPIVETAPSDATPATTEPLAVTIPEPTTPASAAAAAAAPAYSIQIMALRKPVDLDYFTGLPDVRVIYSGDMWYRYTVGKTTREQEAAKTLENMISKGYRDAFIRLRDSNPRYTIQIMAVPGPVVDLSKFGNIKEITVTKGEDNFCRYTTGEFGSEEEAAAMLESIKKMGYSSAFIRRVD
jgi:hypothetical protein